MCVHRAMVLTVLEVVGFAHVDADQGHQLELREPLPSGRRQRQEISQIGNLCVNEIAAELGGSLGGFGGIETVSSDETGKVVVRQHAAKCALNLQHACEMTDTRRGGCPDHRG